MSSTKKILPKLFCSYFTCMASYGFYRGYNNLYNTKLYNTKKYLLTDRIYDGITGSLWQVNPVIQPFLLYEIIRLIEKKSRDLEITKDDY